MDDLFMKWHEEGEINMDNLIDLHRQLFIPWFKEREGFLLKELEDKGRLSSKTVLKLLLLVGNNERWDYFCNLVDCYPMTKAALANGLDFAWTTGRGDDRALYYFKKVGLKNMLKARQRVFFNSLPDVITIYRGCNKLEAEKGHTFGASWTLKRCVAEFFAFRGRGCKIEDGRVFAIKILKYDISALFLDREEQEVVFWYANGMNETLQVVTTQPTKFYYDYIKEVAEYNIGRRAKI